MLLAEQQWTSEEIAMIQQLLVADAELQELPVSAKAFEVRDISISSSSGSVSSSKLAFDASCELQGSSHVLLSPIGADEPFLPLHGAVDEKDALAAFFTEAIDPFQPISPASSKNCSLNSFNSGFNGDRALEKLRERVDALTQVYYAHCQRLSGSAASSQGVSVERMRLLHAVEKLQRVAEALKCENQALVKDTTSRRQQCQQALQAVNGQTEAAPAPQVVKQAVDKLMGLASGFDVMNRGQQLVDASTEGASSGWSYASAWKADSSPTGPGFFSYSLQKHFRSADVATVAARSWEMLRSSQQLSQLFSGATTAQVVQDVDAAASVVRFDLANERDCDRVDRVLAAVFRQETASGVLVGVQAINELLPASDARVRAMDCSAWMRVERDSSGGVTVKTQGQLHLPTRNEAEHAAIEALCVHMRWEAAVGIGGPLLAL